MEGSFTVQKIKKVFSTISIHQAHKQNNAHIKGDGVRLARLVTPVPWAMDDCWT